MTRQTCSSVVGVKSRYQRPTATNGLGVMAHTTSSASVSSSRHVWAAPVGTATTTRAGWRRRTAARAARLDEPVATPSSTRVARADGGQGGPHGRACGHAVVDEDGDAAVEGYRRPAVAVGLLPAPELLF